MANEKVLTVADAKQAFLRWNTEQYKKISLATGNEAGEYIQLIPLFFQLNHKLLPGYTDPDTPVGVFSYKPDKNTIAAARSLNNKFRYQQDGVIQNYAVEAVFFQRQLVNNKWDCWVFYHSALEGKRLSLLKEKIAKLSQWFSGRGIVLKFNVLSAKEFCSRSAEYSDEFYSEIILLAGKYPVWWLVPPGEEYTEYVEHIRQARYVNTDEFIDLGGLDSPARRDIVRNAIELVQKSRQSPETCLVKLLVAEQKYIHWPEADGVSERLKNTIYAGVKDVSPLNVMAGIMHDAFDSYSENSHIMSPLRLFSKLKKSSGELNVALIDAFLADSFVHETVLSGLENIIENLNFFKAISHEIKQIFSNIADHYIAENVQSEADQSLLIMLRNMQDFLSGGDGSVPVYNNKDSNNFVFERIQLKQEKLSNTDQWSLILEVSQGNEKKIEGFNSLLGILAWCWLNRVVNHSTQVSIDSPGQQVKQIEAYYILEALIHSVKPEHLTAIPAEAFENPVRPLQSLLFINFMDQADDHSALCEQLIINSWGEACTRQYSGNTGILNCLCEWTHNAPLDGQSKPQGFLVFGHGMGDTTYMAQRIEKIYEEMQSFFYHTSHSEGRFVLRLDSEYFCIVIDNNLLKPVKLGSKKKLLDLLESPLEKFTITALERLAYTEHPLNEVYRRNKEGVFQVFFQVINRRCFSWVLDERGTLWADVLGFYDRDSYVSHWLYFFRNTKKRFKKINFQDREFPVFEINQISINQLGGTEFYPLGPESVSGSKNFIELEVSITGAEKADQLSLICDGHAFNYNDLKDNVLIECVQFIVAKMQGGGVRSVFVTDIDVPLRLYHVADRECIQISHILKFKRNFEHRVNKLLSR